MLVLNQEQVLALLDMDALIEALAPAMVELSAGKISMPARSMAQTEQGLLGVMPAYLPSSRTLSCKLVSVFPKNGERGLPTHQAAMMLFDAGSGEPLALLDGASITAWRTAAGSALATRLLAWREASVLLIIGTGVQALSHARAIPRVRKIREIRVAGRHPQTSADFARELSVEFDTEVRAFPIAREAFSGAHIVCACTHADQPVVQGAWLGQGIHVNSVGLNAQGCELDRDAVKRASVFVESRAAALAPPPSGANDLAGAEVTAEIGELLAGSHPGRKSSEEITLYKSVGVAVQDAVAARLVYDAALKRRVGTEISL
jgi:alanine dehydrogenase